MKKAGIARLAHAEEAPVSAASSTGLVRQQATQALLDTALCQPAPTSLLAK